jgi:hypothetical protein
MPSSGGIYTDKIVLVPTRPARDYSPKLKRKIQISDLRKKQKILLRESAQTR